MEMPKIEKPQDRVASGTNLDNYEKTCGAFTWRDVRSELASGRQTDTINIADVAVDAQVRRGLGDKTALLWLPRSGRERRLTYQDLSRQSGQFASALQGLGLQKGDVVFSLLGRVPELYVAALGTWKLGAVFCPLFSAFGPEPAKSRMEIAQAKVLVTTERLYRRKIAPVRDQLPSLEHVILTDSSAQGHSFHDLLADGDATFEAAMTRCDDLATLHFTSGTTGKPKGAMHVHEAVVTHFATAQSALDLREDDIFWCTADPGWVTGTSYGIIAPLTIGCTLLSDEQEFDAARWYAVLAEQKVNVWYTAPTAIRMLMKAGDALPKSYDLSHIRFISSVGEPLNPEAVVWGQDVLGLPIHDNWWQSETGGIMIANYAEMAIKPGSMGRPIPGVEAAVVRQDGERFEIIDTPDVEGELALKCSWPSMFRGYLHEQARYEKCFVGDWYMTGDLARRDSDGYYWFVGRADDVIKSAGHLIGPFEVESILMEHPAVAEAAVIGIPDPVAMEVVKAFVALRPGHEPSDPLRRDLMAHARKRLGPAVAPRQIDFRDDLPKTRSGKIMRRLLKAHELGLPEGDLSTLERGTQ
ncbi:MAG: acetate--CoA ligase [Hyphomicrobiaceae bacterium]